MIRFDRVSKQYKVKGVRKVILNEFSFTFPEGRNIGLMGPNGVGKSTLTRLVSGAEPCDAGRITRTGRISWPLAFQGGFNGSMTGYENIRFVSRIYRQDVEQVRAWVEDFSELGKSLDLPIRTYSSGMAAKLAFGLSMAINFDCYLIDETLSVGDERFQKKCEAVFHQRLQHSQIILVSHSASLIREYCDCGLLMTPEGITYHDDVDSFVKAYSDYFSR